MKIDKKLNWKIHIHDLTSNLNKTNSILSKLRHFVSIEIVRSVYFAISQFHINYICIASGLTGYPRHKISVLQKKALKIINFALFRAHITPLFKNSNILKFADFINCFNMGSFFISH